MPSHISAAFSSTYFCRLMPAIFSAACSTQAPRPLMCAILTHIYNHCGYWAIIFLMTMDYQTHALPHITIPWRTWKILTRYTHRANVLEVLSFSSWLCTTACRFLLQQPLGHKRCGIYTYLLPHGIHGVSHSCVFFAPWHFTMVACTFDIIHRVLTSVAAGRANGVTETLRRELAARACVATSCMACPR